VVLRDEALKQGHCIEPNSSSRSAEAYRHLQTNLQFLDVDSPPRVLMVSSAVPAEGKTTVAVNLALALADAGQRVVVIEADLRRPRVTAYLGLVGGVGLTNVLTGRAQVEEVEQAYEDGDLVVIGAGPTAPNPAQLLASGTMAALLAKLRASYDYVILDAPPLLPVADATGLAVLADGVLLSVRHGSTTKDQLRQARATLERVGARIVGTVLNLVPPRDEVSGTYGYDHDYTNRPSLPARR
jgi:capsular exopolysaccharide synthesis family protein